MVRMHRVLLALGLLVGGTAHATPLAYRVCGIEPASGGANLIVACDNALDSTARKVNSVATLFVHGTDPQPLPGWTWHQGGGRSKPGGRRVGDFDQLLGKPGKPVRLHLDYAKLGLQPGQPVWTEVSFWRSIKGRQLGSHNWGDSQAGRGAGGPHVLPQPAIQNSRLGRQSSPLGHLQSSGRHPPGRRGLW